MHQPKESLPVTLEGSGSEAAPSPQDSEVTQK